MPLEWTYVFLISISCSGPEGMDAHGINKCVQMQLGGVISISCNGYIRANEYPRDKDSDDKKVPSFNLARLYLWFRRPMDISKDIWEGPDSYFLFVIRRMKGTSLCRKRFINVKIRNAIKVFLLGKEHKNGISEEVELRTEAYPSFRSRSFGMLSRGFMCLLWQMSLRFLCNFAVQLRQLVLSVCAFNHCHCYVQSRCSAYLIFVATMWNGSQWCKYQLNTLEVHPKLFLEEEDDFPPQQQIHSIALVMPWWWLGRSYSRWESWRKNVSHVQIGAKWFFSPGSLQFSFLELQSSCW
jgi:hypothetical protein